MAEADYTSLAFSPSGEPYVAYQDYGNSAKATIMKFNGSNWVNVGTAGFSAGKAYYTSLAFSPSERPYVAYEDIGNSYKATVMKYDYPNGINEPQHSQVSIYPNPASDKITIETSSAAVQRQLTISNLNGQELITRQITQPKTQIDISSLPSGVYVVKLTCMQSIATTKLIKQ